MMKRLWIVLLGLAVAGGPPAARAQTGDVDPPVIRILEGGTELGDGALFARPVVPVVEVTDASPVTVTSTLDGDAFTSGTAVGAEGAHELSVVATDDAGNTASLLVGFEIDTTPPAFGGVTPAEGSLLAATEVTLQGSVAGAVSLTVDGQPVSLAGSTFVAGPFPLAEGLRSFTLVAADAAGNDAQLVLEVTRDLTPPAVAILQPAAGTVVSASPVDVVGTVSDVHLDGGSVAVNGTVATITGTTYLARNVPLAEGETTLTAVATDAAGNGAQAERAVSLDTAAPTVAISDPASGTVVPGASLPVSGTAADPHLDRVEVNGVRAQLAGSSWTATVPLVEGSNNLVARAFDTLGWTSTETVGVLRDSQAPAIRIEAPQEGAHLNVESVDVAGTIEPEEGLEITVNGTPVSLAGSTWSAPGISLVEGENRLIARVVDRLGNQGAHTRLVYRDTVPPQLVGSDPAAGALAVPPEASFTLTFSEELGPPAAGALRLETAAGEALAADATLQGTTLEVRPQAPLASRSEVHLVLTAALVDLAGNGLESPATLTFFVRDTEPPATPVLVESPPPALCAPRLELAGSAEAGSMVEVDGGAARSSVRAGSDGTFTLSVELVPAMRNLLEVTAVDPDGNRSAALEIAVEHDCVAPSVVDAILSGGEVAVRFSEPVAPASLAPPGALTLTAGSGPVPGSLTVSGASAVFVPTDPLPAGPLRLDVGAVVEDLAGNRLGYPYSAVLGGAVTPSFLSGRVVDDATGRPLAGAQVVVAMSDGVLNPEPRPEQTTAADGRFRIPVAAGTHYVLALRPGYTPVVRIATATTSAGTDLFDPRLTPVPPIQELGPAGGTFTGPGDLALEVPGSALGEVVAVTVTPLEEQALPALLPYGWSPRGAAWVDLAGAALAAPAELTLPVGSADGTDLVLVRLEATTLQWQVVALAAAAGGSVSLPVTGEGGYAAVEADGGTVVPPAAVVGTVLGSSAAPAGDEVSSAAVSFSPAVVLPSQRSEATVAYQLSQEAASGLPLTLSIRETLTLLDGKVRTEPPYEADVVLYHTSGGAAASRFGLVPSELAQSLPLEVGAEDVTVRPYAGETVRGNVLGPSGGSVATEEGDRVDLAAGALAEPAAVLLARRAAADLPLPLPVGTLLAGALDLDLSGRTLLTPAALSLVADPAPAAGESGLLLAVVDLGSGPLYRPVAALAPTATGWATAAIDPADLPWPGVREGGLYVFAQLADPVGFLRGHVFDIGGSPLPAALLSSPSLPWIQLSGASADYVLPAWIGPLTAVAENLSTANLGAADTAVPAAEARVDLDLTLAVTGPRVLEVTPTAGATEITPGIEPTVRFSEPVEAASLPAGLVLYRGSEGVAVRFDVQGSLVRLLPEATLRPGQTYEIRVTTGVRDLQGYRLEAAVSSTFTTLEAPSDGQVDLTRIHLFEPDAAGLARVLGRPGAVPAGSLVFAENISRFASTVSVTAGTDGGFELEAEAALGDTLLLHVLPAGQNEVVVELPVFLTADGRGAHATAEEATFTTVDDITVHILPGTFLAPTSVRLTPRPTEESRVPIPSDFRLLVLLDVDFGGAEAQKALEIRLPAPAGVVADELLLARAYEVLGEPAWMLYDLLRRDGEAFTTAPLPAPLAQAGSGPVVPPDAAAGAPGAGGEVGAAGLEPLAAPATFAGRREYLPGAANPGRYMVLESTAYLDFVSLPLPTVGFYAYFQQLGLDGLVAVVNQAVTRLLEHDAVLLPTRRGEALSVVGRDLSTGYEFFAGSFDPPLPGEILFPPPTTYGDSEAPVPVAGSPARFYLLEVSGAGGTELDVGLVAEVTTQAAGTSLTVSAVPGTFQAGIEARLLGLDSGLKEAVRTGADGALSLSAAVTPGARYLLAVGARLGVQEPLEIAFSEPLPAGLPGIAVEDSLGQDVHPRITAARGAKVVRIEPAAGWQAGGTYHLRLTGALRDASGNSWGRELSLELQVEESRVLSTLALDEVRDVARLGSLLFVAAGADGLVVVDAADPAHLANLVAGGVSFPFPLADPVSGVAVDPHGRVVVVGGGVNGFGQMKIFDPLAFDPAAVAADPDDPAVRYAAFRGSTLLSDKLTGPGTSLPEGRPRRVAVLSSDQTDRWRIGAEEPPEGVTVSVTAIPNSSESTATVAGNGWLPGRPVTLRDRTRGRWNRSDSDAAGHWEMSLRVEVGDAVELLRNERSVAYVATQGVGLEVVDVNAFYGESHDDPGDPAIASDLVGVYTGFGDPSLSLCGQAVSDLGAAMLDLGTLFETEGPHPLTLVGLVGFRGLALFESDPANVGHLSFFNSECLNVGGSANVSGLEVVEDYPFDWNGDGRLEPSEVRDLLVVAHRTAGVLVFDAENRDELQLVGRVALPGQAAQVRVDRARRRLYVSAYGGGLYVVDFDRPPTVEAVDHNRDTLDDRVLETLVLPGNTNAPALLVPELGLAYAGGLERGLTAITVGPPRLVAVAGPGAAPDAQPVGRLAPLGVPTAPASAAPGAPDLPASFRIVASLPGVAGNEVRLDVESLGPGGLPIAGAGDPGLIVSLPKTALTGLEEGLVLHRSAEHRWEEGYQIYRSQEVVAVADLRAAHDFSRTAKESDACTRCDGGALGISDRAREILSGEEIAVRLPESLRTTLGAVYTSERLGQVELELPSVPWDLSPSVRQEPTRNPSLGSGDAAPVTLLHSGEAVLSATDLAVRGRGFDFAFTRTYRSQTVGAGPLGPGWDFNYRKRLRALPNGDVDYFDGRGRKETYRQGSDGTYQAPAGRFVELTRTATGWVWIGPHRGEMRFDRFGRLEAIADAVKDSATTGNEMRFGYDLAGRLTTITDTLGRRYTLEYDAAGRLAKLGDFTGREVRYAYDPDGRLTSVTGPAVTVGEAAFPGGLRTLYGYDPVAAGDLAPVLTGRDDLTSVTDPRGVEWLTATYTDGDGDTRAEEVTAETWGGDGLSIAYDFPNRTATVTDRRGKSWIYEHDAAGHPTKVTDPTGASTRLAYDAEGLLSTRIEPLGRVTSITYDTAGDRRSRGNATEVDVTAGTGGANGSTGTLATRTAYDPGTNRPATVTDPRGAVTTYTRTASGLPTRIDAPEGATTELEYNDYGQVTRSTNPNGHVTEYVYYGSGDAEGYLEKETVDPGELALTTRYEVDSRGNVTAVVDPRGTRYTSVYNELDWRVAETAAAGSLNYTTTYVYDPAGEVTEVREPYGLGGATASTRTTYGPLGEVLSVARDIEPTGGVATTTYEYDENRNPTRVTDPDGHVTTTVYDDRNRLVGRTMGEGTAEAMTEGYAYDAEGHLLTWTDALGHEWKSEYDGFGRLAASVDPLGERTEQSYDAGGHVTGTRWKDADGELLARAGATYDLLGRPTTRTEYLWTGDPGTAAAITTTTTYDGVGNVIAASDPLNHETFFAYDAAERLVDLLDPVGNETTYQLNATGQPVAVTLTEVVAGGGSAATTTTHEVDALGRETASIDPLGNATRFTLDARGHARLVTDPEGNSTERVYDSLGRMLSETRPEGIRIDLAYDANGNRTSYTDARGNATAWSYDALDRVRSVHYPDGTTESAAYDAAGNAIELTQPSGTTVTQTFDAAHRLTARSVALAGGLEGPTAESFVYDDLGRLIQATAGTAAGSITSTRTYDSLSRVTSETTAGRTVNYQLDAAGNVTALKYPSGVTVTRQVDDLDRLEAIPGVATYGYRGPDRVVQKAVGALTGTVGYDGARRPTSRQVRVGSQVVYLEKMGWSPRGLMTSQSRRAGNDTSFVMAQDGAGRLTSRSHVGAPGPSSPGGLDHLESFGYDAAQNLVRREEAGIGSPVTRKTLPAGTQNRPLSVDGQGLSWDANGNLVAKGSWRYHYDFRNRLTRVSLASGAEIATYGYDAFNRLVSTDHGGSTDTTVWAGWQPIEVYRSGSLRERRTFGLGLDELVQLEVDLDDDGALDQTYTPLYDQTGNVVALTDPTGRIIERYEYSTYGFRVAVTDSTPPEILQLLFRAGALQVNLSEEILRAALVAPQSAQGSVTAGTLSAQLSAVTEPPTVSLRVTATGEEIPIEVSFPEELGRFAFRRAVLTPTGTPPDPGTEVTLRIEPAGVQDLFFNQKGGAFEETFAWPDTETVEQDTAVPEVEEVLTRGGHLEIAFSEEVDLASAQAAIQIDGAPVAWELDETRFRLRSVDPVDPAATTLEIGTGVQDLAGTPLATALSLDLTAPIAVSSPELASAAAMKDGASGPSPGARSAAVLTSPDAIFYKLAKADQTLTSTTGNHFGFQGRELDFATGLVYFRNRWYDPELGRFIQQDPLGYADAPSLYQFAGNDPVDAGDPLGLRKPTKQDLAVQRSLEARLTSFDWSFAEDGEATALLLDAGFEYPHWWSTEKEPYLRTVEVRAVSEASYKTIRAQLQRDLDSFKAAVARADESGAIQYSYLGKYYTYTQADRVRDLKLQALTLWPILVGDVVAIVGSPVTMRGARVELVRWTFENSAVEIPELPVPRGTANPVLGRPRVGSALKDDLVKPVRDAQGRILKEFPATPKAHGFPDVVDNFAAEATQFQLRGGASLYQVEGSLNGVAGRFEWIVDNGQVTHRMFVAGGTVNGVPITP